MKSFCLDGKDIENKSLKLIFFFKKESISDGVRLINTVANRHKMLKKVGRLDLKYHTSKTGRRLALCFALENLRSSFPVGNVDNLHNLFFLL